MSVRPNARVLRSSRAAVLSSLLPVYHSSLHFLPLDTTKLTAVVNPIIAPLDNHSYNNPSPKHLGSAIVESGSSKFTAQQATNQSLTELMSKVATSSVSQHAFEDNKSFHASWLNGLRSGKEHELVKRVRNVVDALHGTTAGGQAGLVTLEEMGEQAVEEARIAQAERSADAEAARQQEARDARLEAHYAEEESARA